MATRLAAANSGRSHQKQKSSGRPRPDFSGTRCSTALVTRSNSTHAAIFESVELVRQSGNEYAVGLVNAVLRKLAQIPKLDETDAVAAHPQWMVDRWIAAFGLDISTAICRYDQLPPTSEEPGVFVVRARQRIQDEGSQLIAELAGRGTEILDCCAAPGGKTAILAERNPTASITACDISPARLKAMQALLKGQPNIHFRVLDATDLPFQNQFDLVLCDAPCSGTGTLARNPEIKHRIKPPIFSVTTTASCVFSAPPCAPCVKEAGSSTPPAPWSQKKTSQ